MSAPRAPKTLATPLLQIHNNYRTTHCITTYMEESVNDTRLMMGHQSINAQNASLRSFGSSREQSSRDKCSSSSF